MVDNRHKSSKIYIRKRKISVHSFHNRTKLRPSMADTSTFSLLISHNSIIVSPKPTVCLRTDNR